MISTEQESTTTIIQRGCHDYQRAVFILPLPSEICTMSLVDFSKATSVQRELQNPNITAIRWQEILEFIRARLLSNQFPRNDMPKSERARKRWQRAIFFGARLGRGILHAGSDNPLLLKTVHWLESVDIEHRYGSNLRIYHDYWRAQSDVDGNFFYWLDHGGGKTLDLPACPRSKLEKEKLVYCSHEERERFRVKVDPKTRLLVYASTNIPVHTFSEPGLCRSTNRMTELTGVQVVDSSNQHKISEIFKFIYVISPTRSLYIHRKIRGHFQHSSFLAGQSVWGAGGIEVNHGKLVKVTLHSGHYRPTVQHLDRFFDSLKTQGVELDHVIKETFKNKTQSFDIRQELQPQHICNNVTLD